MSGSKEVHQISVKGFKRWVTCYYYHCPENANCLSNNHDYRCSHLQGRVLSQWWNMDNHFSLETEWCFQQFISSSTSLGDHWDEFNEISVAPWSGRSWIVQTLEAAVWDQSPPISVQVSSWIQYWPDAQCCEMRMLSLPSQAAIGTYQPAGRLLWDPVHGCRYREFQTWLRSKLRPVPALLCS